MTMRRRSSGQRLDRPRTSYQPSSTMCCDPRGSPSTLELGRGWNPASATTSAPSASTDARAAESAAAVGARAYTVGSHVVMGAGEYRPTTAAGRRLLVHELAHVVQQAGSTAAVLGRLTLGRPDTAQEREADHVADHLPVSGIPAHPVIPLGSVAAGTVSRQPSRHPKLPGAGQATVTTP